MADVNGRIMVSSTVDMADMDAMADAEAVAYEAMEAVALVEGITVDEAYRQMNEERED